MENELYHIGTKTLTAVGGVAGVGLFIVAFLFVMNYKWFWLTSAGAGGFIFAFLALQQFLAGQFLGCLVFAFITWVCWTITVIALKHIPGGKKQDIHHPASQAKEDTTSNDKALQNLQASDHQII